MNVQVQDREERVRIPSSAIGLDCTPNEFLLQREVRHASQIERARVVGEELGEEKLDRVVVDRLGIKELKVDIEHLAQHHHWNSG